MTTRTADIPGDVVRMVGPDLAAYRAIVEAYQHPEVDAATLVQRMPGPHLHRLMTACVRLYRLAEAEVLSRPTVDAVADGE